MTSLRIIFLSDPWTILLNIAAWAVVQIGISVLFLEMPIQWFDPHFPLFRSAPWENQGHFYQKWLRIRKWKGLYPSLARYVGKENFRLDRVQSKDPEYLDRWARETCRSELCHWVTIASAILFILWNEPWVGWVMLVYGMLFNLPLVLIQRYNRFKIVRTLDKQIRQDSPAPIA
jgi:glycosyl-4,4'-diaponeurosporenoate acyltransferase